MKTSQLLGALCLFSIRSKSSILSLIRGIALGSISTVIVMQASFLANVLHPWGSVPDLSFKSIQPLEISDFTSGVSDLCIYCRTKKTGSSYMLTALLESLIPMGSFA